MDNNDITVIINKILPTLKPCPFCGSKDLEYSHSTEDREGIPYAIVCGNCGASSGYAYLPNGLTDFINNWNNRVESEE